MERRKCRRCGHPMTRIITQTIEPGGLLPDLGGGKQTAARRAVEPGRGRPDLRRVGGHG